MALTRTVTHGANISTALTTTVVTHTITATSLVVAVWQYETDNTNGIDAATPMTVSGTAMTWTKLLDTSPTPLNTVVVTRVYAAISNGAGSRTFTHTKTNSSGNRRLSIFAFEGALTTVATAIPSGNRFVTTTAAANVSRSITPAGTGSMIMGVIGDWAQTNSFVALTNNTATSLANVSGSYNSTCVEPTTNPLASGAAFTWGANTTGGSCTYAVIEIVPLGGVAAKSSPMFGAKRMFFPRRINR